MSAIRITGNEGTVVPPKIKPVYIMNQAGLSDLEKKAVLDGASEMIRLAQADVDIADFGVWRNNGFRNRDGSLKQYQSVDWYVERGRDTSRNTTQLNASTMQNLLMLEPWRYAQQGGKDHYDILVVHDDMYSGDTNFVIGLAQPGIGTTISTNRFGSLNNELKYECIKTETMHELGHVFGLIPDERTENVEHRLGKHCTNRCTMRQGLTLPNDWINITKDRLKYGALCPTCETDLKEYFRR
ncbi:MAG: hypothetical protein V1702_03880 [Candidatus Woesearchaeota archaeon]